MNRAQRLAHGRIWWVLGPALVLAVVASLLTRGYPAQAPPPAVREAVAR